MTPTGCRSPPLSPAEEQPSSHNRSHSPPLAGRTRRPAAHPLRDLPVEMIFGLLDPAAGSTDVRDKWLSHFPAAQVKLVDNAGHFTQEDTPESYIAALHRILAHIESTAN